MGRFRPDKKRLGDFTDQLKIFRDIMKRDPAVRAKVQTMFDHVIVDEAQNRNTVMSEMIDLMSQHITTEGEDGKSVWIVGDDKQAINSFQGAKAALFKDLFQKEGWKTRVIRTNYRCEPEIVDAANKLIANNEGNVPIPQVPSPDRKPGVGSIKVQMASGTAEAALSAIEEIKQAQVLGEDLTDNAVLCRTNKEIHAYETACIIRGIPYARKGAGSFLGSPETKAVLGYVQLVTGTDFEKMQKALAQVIDTPNRFWISDKKRIPEAVERALADFARSSGQNVKSINPLVALEDRGFLRTLANNLGRLTRTGKSFKFEEKLHDLLYTLQDIKTRVADPDYTTKEMFGDILSIEGVGFVKGEIQPQTFRESLKADLRDQLGGEDEEEKGDDDEEEDELKGLGNVAFLFKLAEPDPTDEDDSISPPGSPAGFAAKMARYASKMRDLRTDINEWQKKQNALPPEQRKRPPGVYLGTVHSVKGAQWKTTFVQMPKGKFPMEFKPKPGQPPPDPVKEQERWEDERRLGYVALTRAAKNLRIICPQEIDGKAAGASSFVYEAGLVPGENIPKQEGGIPAPPPEIPPDGLPPKASSEESELMDIYGDHPWEGYHA
jgi:superfamily I DNA/RNA helicase